MDFACPGLQVEGEVKLTVYDRTKVAKRKLFHFWFHTAFVEDMALRLSKSEIDGCHRDTHHRVFAEGFTVLLEFEPDVGAASDGAPARASVAGEQMEGVAVTGPGAGGDGAAEGCCDIVAPMPVDQDSDTEAATGTEEDGAEGEEGGNGAAAGAAGVDD